jgi:hypothetical protein
MAAAAAAAATDSFIGDRKPLSGREGFVFAEGIFGVCLGLIRCDN